MWYAAHVIMYYKFDKGPQEDFPILENIFVLDAPDSRAAHDEAERIGRSEEVHSGLAVDDRPATLVFAGVRKVVECQSPKGMGLLDHGTEATYSAFTVRTLADLERLVEGESVPVIYDE
jgi:hypothetical protein